MTLDTNATSHREAPTTPADFRAEIARHKLLIYDLAPHVGMHPAKLGAVLNGRAPLTPAVAARLIEAIERQEPRSR